jgi:RNA polymerase sigma factor (sigma-70 family)
MLACGDVPTDAQLLERFVTCREEAALAALLQRHGPMVLAVCRRTLSHVQDAEDAFQATFLVLAKKAPSVCRRELLSGWLHGVAYRTALRAKVLRARRQAREKKAARPEAVPQERRDDLLPLLDAALSRLPDRYRLPVVLCDLEGKAYREAARLLGWPEGTLAGRLSRARALLARRLARYGLGPAGMVLAVAVPAGLGAATARVALELAGGRKATPGLISPQVAALTDETMRALLLVRLRALAAALAALLAVAGAGWLARPAPGPDRPPVAHAAGQEAPPDAVRNTRAGPPAEPLPPGAVARLGTADRLRQWGCSALAFSADGQFLAAGNQLDNRVTLWDPRTGQEIRRLPAAPQPARRLNALAFSPRGHVLACALGGPEGVVLWDVATGTTCAASAGRTCRPAPAWPSAPTAKPSPPASSSKGRNRQSSGFGTSLPGSCCTPWRATKGRSWPWRLPRRAVEAGLPRPSWPRRGRTVPSACGTLPGVPRSASSAGGAR